MSFQIGFNGPASADLTHLLQGVERQLNWHSVRAQAPGDASGSASAPAMSDQVAASAIGPCTDATDPHDPNCIRVREEHHAFHEGAAIGFIVGLIVGIVLTAIFIKKKGSQSAAG
jgi:hypothetical protein